MEYSVIKLLKGSDKENLVNYLNQQSNEEIASTIQSRLNSKDLNDDVDPMLFIQGILAGSPVTHSEACVYRRILVFKEAIHWLSKDTESGAKQATHVFNLLLPEVDTLDSTTLYEFAIEITSFVQNQVQVQSRLFELFSKIWNVLSATDHQADDIIDRLLTATWHQASAISIASVFNEMELSSSQLNKVCKRIIKELGELDVDETPPFVYQLLLLSRKGMKKEIISSICQHFLTLKEYASEIAATPNFRRMEGTVMLHMSFAIKQDQELGKELIKYVKNDKSHALETFPVACLLSAARIHRLEDLIFDLLRSTIITVYKDSDKLKQCNWISQFSRIDGNRLHEVMIEIAKNSEHGWDQVIQPLTQLAMLLIDFASSQGFAASRPTTIATDNSVLPPPVINKNKHSPIDNVILLGKDILIKMFELHKIVRSEILDQITARIVSHSPSTTHFLDILEKIIAHDYFTIEPYTTNLRDTLDYLSLLPYTTADRLLKALQPVANKNAQFRDGLMLVLRKSMYAKDLNGRMVSVNGFLSLLSNVFTEQERSIYPSQGIAFEILGLLRRCFNQQAEIRATVYKGLASLSEHRDITADIFEILYAQFQRIYEKDHGMITPIRLDMCIESSDVPKLVEPIHILLSSLFKTLQNLEKNNMDTTTTSSVISDQVTQCREDLSSLVFRLSKSDLEDYELDKTADFDLATHVGMRNNIYAGLLQGTYEAAMEYEYFERKDTLESFQTILTIFKKRMETAALLKEGSPFADKGRKSTAMQAEYSVASLEFLTDVTRRMFTEGSIQRPIRALRGDIGYVHYIVLSIQTALKKTTQGTSIQERSFQRCIELGKICMDILKTEDSDSSFVLHQPKKGQVSVLESIWDAFKNIFETVLQLWPNRLEYFYSSLTNSPASMDIIAENINTSNGENINTVIFNVVRILEEIMTKYLSDRTPLYKEAAKLMQVITFLSNRMNKDGKDFRQRAGYMTDWLGSMIKQRPLEEINLAKQIIQLQIHLCAEIQDFITIVYISQDLHVLHGDIMDEVGLLSEEDEEEERPPVQYLMINQKTAHSITLLLLSFMEQLYDDMLWCIGRLKLAASTEVENVQEFENVVCKRIKAYLNVTSEFTKAVLMGQHAEYLIKTLIKTYKTLSALTKYKINARPKYISDDFTSMINIAGTEVTDKMYQFLMIHGQEGLTDGTHFTDSTKNKKKGKATTGHSNKSKNIKEKAKILRDSKMIPKLIYEVEEFERQLIQLTRKSNKDLMQYMKRSTARDFKINLDVLISSTTEQQQDDPEEEEDPKHQIATRNFRKTSRSNDDDDDTEGDRGSKRPRVM